MKLLDPPPPPPACLQVLAMKLLFDYYAIMKPMVPAVSMCVCGGGGGRGASSQWCMRCVWGGGGGGGVCDR